MPRARGAFFGAGGTNAGVDTERPNPREACMPDRIVIVGGGLAGATAATELRKRGFDGSIRILAAEPHSPYIRPPLSKGYLQGSEERSAAFVHPDEWYARARRRAQHLGSGREHRPGCRQRDAGRR